MFELHVKTYEVDGKGKARPVLEHVFFGATKKEAEGYADSHEKTDSFFKHCGAGALDLGKKLKVWRGIHCYAECWWVQK